MPLPSAVATPMGDRACAGNGGSRLERLVSDTVADWHRTGLLIETVQRWGVPAGGYLDGDAGAVDREARRTAAALHTPAGRQLAGRECREDSRVAPTDVTGLHRLALLIRERTGLNLLLLYDRWEQGQIVRGLIAHASALIVASIAGSLAIGGRRAPGSSRAGCPWWPRLCSGSRPSCG